MHIKTLEIAGFKSFVDRTSIHFDQDVVGVVGPNGCGKSNIVDAIRWCLGEQSAKHLRGRSMDDVIFNGSESRGPAGLAEVTLTLDNTNPEYAATLPPEYRDYAEIAVTRRLFRDGTSEYLINKTQVRLRDVTELFLGTGVGTKAYSVIEQGRIGQIVSARPEDRRLFLEEAAGVTKYKQRRRQAERKMELSQQNLVRISDIVSEIDRNRASLKRQVAKAERFLEYRRELDDLVLHDATHRLLECVVMERVERQAYDAASGESTAVRGRMQEAEGALDQARAHATQTEAGSDDASRQAFDADQEVSGLLAEIERARDHMQHLDARLGTGRGELEETAARSGEARSEREALGARLQGLSADEREREADALVEVEALSGLQAEEALAASEVLELRQQTGELGAKIAAAEARLAGIAERVADARSRRDRLAQERDGLDGELADQGARRGALERSVQELTEGKRLTEAEREALAGEMETLRARQLESERAVDTVKNEIGLRRNRLRALEDLHRRLEGVGAGARALLTKGDPRVLGLLADRLEAPEELTLAVAGLLSTRLQAVVVTERSSGLELLAELQRDERGRADVVAARPAYTAGGAQPWETDPLVLGRLVDRVTFAESDEPLMRAVLGDAALVKTAADAVEVVERHPSLTAVAQDGTVAHPDGTISGGSGDDVASAMIEQKREMHQLRDELTRFSADAERLIGEHNGARARVTEIETALDRARQDAHQGELAQVTAEKDLARSVAEIASIEARLKAIATELSEIDQMVAAQEVTDAESRSELETVLAELERIQHALGRAETTAQTWRDRVSSQSALVTERRVRLAQVKEQREAARAAQERVEATLAELEARADRLRVELDEAAQSYGEAAAEMLAAREARIVAVGRAQAAHQELERARELLEGARQSVSAHELGLKQQRDALDVLDERTKKHELGVQRIELERTHLLASVRERFRGLDLHRVVGDYHARPAPDAEHRRRIEELSQLIDRMGPVNLDARAEHEAAERRFAELNDQKVDIEQALEELERAIRHMNRESRRRFRETFDQVNALFRKTFGKLFRGGRAELQLTNPEDLLGSGVEIIAQPPGKKLGNIELMSGGEKALTAVALIFSILQHRPSPFCVLDEVDAPLDEANVKRYNEMIRQLTTQSQFILITHVRSTMQSVDVLYGITMGEPGVSRLVGVRVKEGGASRTDSILARGEPSKSEPVAGVA